MCFESRTDGVNCKWAVRENGVGRGTMIPGEMGESGTCALSKGSGGLGLRSLLDTCMWGSREAAEIHGWAAGLLRGVTGKWCLKPRG